jgi:hypothetical protein
MTPKSNTSMATVQLSQYASFCQPSTSRLVLRLIMQVMVRASLYISHLPWSQVLVVGRMLASVQVSSQVGDADIKMLVEVSRRAAEVRIPSSDLAAGANVLPSARFGLH